MAERASGDTALYRTESPWGERLGRVLFWKDAGAVSERRAALHGQGSPDHDGTLDYPPQHGPSAQQSRGPGTCPRNDPARELRTDMDR